MAVSRKRSKRKRSGSRRRKSSGSRRRSIYYKSGRKISHIHSRNSSTPLRGQVSTIYRLVKNMKVSRKEKQKILTKSYKELLHNNKSNKKAIMDAMRNLNFSSL